MTKKSTVNLQGATVEAVRNNEGGRRYLVTPIGELVGFVLENAEFHNALLQSGASWKLSSTTNETKEKPKAPTPDEIRLAQLGYQPPDQGKQSWTKEETDKHGLWKSWINPIFRLKTYRLKLEDYIVINFEDCIKAKTIDEAHASLEKAKAKHIAWLEQQTAEGLLP